MEKYRYYNFRVFLSNILDLLKSLFKVKIAIEFTYCAH